MNDQPVTLMIHYSSQEASDLRYLFFIQIFYRPSLKNKSTIEGQTVIPEHTKVSASFCTDYDS